MDEIRANGFTEMLVGAAEHSFVHKCDVQLEDLTVSCKPYDDLQNVFPLSDICWYTVHSKKCTVLYNKLLPSLPASTQCYLPLPDSASPNAQTEFLKAVHRCVKENDLEKQVQFILAGAWLESQKCSVDLTTAKSVFGEEDDVLKLWISQALSHPFPIWKRLAQACLLRLTFVSEIVRLESLVLEHTGTLHFKNHCR